MADSIITVFCFVAFVQTTLAVPITLPEPCYGEVIVKNGNQEILGALGAPRITGATFTPMPNAISELTPNLQCGDISLSGELPIGGTIKVSGCFPVYGLVAIDGTLPSSGTAVVNSGCQFPAQIVQQNTCCN